MKEQNNIEELFQESFKNFEVDPGANAWANIQSGMQAGASATVAAKAGSSWFTTIGIGILVSSIVVGGYFFFNQKGEENKSQNSAKKPIESSIVVEEKLQQQEPVLNQESESLSNDNAEAINNPIEQSTASEQQKLKLESKKEAESSITENNQEVEKKEEKITVAQIRVVKADKDDIAETVYKAPIEELAIIAEDAHAPKLVAAQETQTGVQEEKEKANTPIEEKTTNKKDVAPDIYIPNTFSPNQDGTNDVFLVEAKEDVDAFEINILNQSGKVIFQSKDLSTSWNGNLPDGSLAPEGTYAYQLVVVKEEKAFPMSGLFQLSR